MHVLHSYNLGAIGATDVNFFFSVLTPEHFGIKDSIKDITLEEMFKMMYKNDLSEPALPSSKIMMSSNEVSAED